MYSFKLADRESRRSAIKTVAGRQLILVAIQKSRRKRRTKYVYNIAGTGKIFYNRSKDGIVFFPIARRADNMAKYFDCFVRPPLSPGEKEWMARNDYEAVT